MLTKRAKRKCFIFIIFPTVCRILRHGRFAHYYVRVSQVSSENATRCVESKVVRISTERTPAGNISTSHPVYFASPSAAKRPCLAITPLQSINVTCVSSTRRSTLGIPKFVCFCYAFRALKSSFFFLAHTCNASESTRCTQHRLRANADGMIYECEL